MDAIESRNAGLRGVLPRGYQRLEKASCVELLRLFAPLPRTLSGDAFGLIYEYFLANFAAHEGRLGGEFFTPQSIVRLIVEVIEPFHGQGLRPRLRLGRHVRPLREVRRRAQGLADPRPLGLRAGAKGGHGVAE